MLQSILFTKTLKDAPKDEVSTNAKLLLRGGFVHKEMAGVYSYLPLGLRVLNNIIAVIRQEMNNIGGQEVLLTALQDPEIWKKSGRWDESVNDTWFKTRLHSGENFHGGTELGLANTHEEPLANLLRGHVSSYKDLPAYIYQFQTKFRNELRAKSGIMRSREFIMKDLYSFSRTEEGFLEFYETCAQAYMNIFKRVGLGDRTYRTFASGGSFSRFSDEFQTVCEAGEDTIYINKEKNIAVNKEVYTDDVLAELDLNRSDMEEAKAIEVGNIFPLGTKFAEDMGLHYLDEAGSRQTPVMGSYGIGPGRVMGAVVEALSDEKGIIWPESIAPFKAHLLYLKSDNEMVIKEADIAYASLRKAEIEVLYDDRLDVTSGTKFADADLIGIPWRLVISEKSLANGGVEVKKRSDSESQLVPFSKLTDFFRKA